MREDICTIPINDVFGPRDGCPFCRMRDMLEDRIAVYVTGAAMMEPDVRIETNRLGFCEPHFRMIRERGNRLSVALILESHLKEIEELVFSKKEKGPSKKDLAAAAQLEKSCFMCENIEKNMKHLSETVLTMWQTDAEFRSLYQEQPYICLPHYNFIMEHAQRLPRRQYPAFAQETAALAAGYLRSLQEDITHFCRMFDYRSKGGDWGNSRDAIERSIQYITSRSVVEKTDETDI